MRTGRLDTFARTLAEALPDRMTRRGLGRLSGLAAGGLVGLMRGASAADAKGKKKKRKKKRRDQLASPPPFNPCAGQADGTDCGADAICQSGVCVCPSGSDICGGQCLTSCGSGQRRVGSTCQCIACITEGPLADTCETNLDCCSDRCAPLLSGTLICRARACRAAGADCTSSFQCCSGNCRTVNGNQVCDSGS